MALNSIGVINPVLTVLGASDAILQAQLGLSDVNAEPTVQMNLTVARQTLDDSKVDSEFDNAEKMISVARNTEKSIVSTLSGIFTAEVSAIDSFYNSQYGSGLRSYFAVSGATQWTDEFRALWSRVMRTELIVHLGDITNTTGTWGAFAADKTISLNTALEIRCTTAITASVAVSVLLTKSGGGTELVAVNIPASTAINTVFPIKGIAGKYNGISTVTAVGGEDADVLAFWVAL